MAEGAKAGMQGGVPQVKVGSVDPNLPECGKWFTLATIVTPGSASVQLQCSRKTGHYGSCGRVQPA